MEIRLQKIADYLGYSYQPPALKLIKKNKFNILCMALTNQGQREKNEDYYKIIFHPLDDSLMMVLIADGVGGYSNGDIASFFACESLNDFFQNSSLDDINDTKLFSQKIKETLAQINEKILEVPYYIGETTLSGIVINKNDIIMIQIGDSRIYTYDESLKQVSVDESDAYVLYQKGLLLKDDIRFVAGNNYINNALGDRFYKQAPLSIVAKNKVKALLLTTDGITDIVSDKVLNQVFAEHFISNPEKILEIVIDKAINGPKEIISEEIDDRIYQASESSLYEIIPGKDNATAVLTLI